MRRSISDLDWRLALVAFAIATGIWYYVNISKESRENDCRLPAFPTSEAMEAYKVCLEGHRGTQNLTNDVTGIKP